jgi:SAM-dependent methyltransferase
MRDSFNVEDMRRFSRRPYTGDVECLLDKRISLKGRIRDFSEAGVGIETDFPLEPGYTLTLKNGFGECAGVVKWAARINDSMHRAGLMFETIGTEALSVAIDRFVAGFENIEKKCLIPGHDQDEVMKLTRQTFMNMKKACELFEEEHRDNKKQIKEAQKKLRGRTNPISAKSYLWNRVLTWPQGYPGDYKTLEAFYKNTPQSTGIGFYIDRYILSTELAVAIVGRKQTMKRLLLDELSKRKNARILDIACGSCRELVEISPDIEANNSHVTCVDLDSDALAFSAARLSTTGVSMDRFTFRKYNALKMISHERSLKEFGMQDIIYSTGLYDYLESAVLVRMFRALYQLLNPGGTMIISFKDCKRYSTFDYHWVSDWDTFYQRQESDCWKILDDAGIERKSVATEREESGVILFFMVSKELCGTEVR